MKYGSDKIQFYWFRAFLIIDFPKKYIMPIPSLRAIIDAIFIPFQRLLKSRLQILGMVRKNVLRHFRASALHCIVMYCINQSITYCTCIFRNEIENKFEFLQKSKNNALRPRVFSNSQWLVMFVIYFKKLYTNLSPIVFF